MFNSFEKSQFTSGHYSFIMHYSMHDFFRKSLATKNVNNKVVGLNEISWEMLTLLYKLIDARITALCIVLCYIYYYLRSIRNSMLSKTLFIRNVLAILYIGMRSIIIIFRKPNETIRNLDIAFLSS